MRAFRGLTIAAVLLLNVGAAGAQASRGFKDSWFWGAKSGLLNYQVLDNAVAESPFALMAGGDWLITRTNGGLYIAFDHTFFSANVFVNDSVSPLVTSPRPVLLSGMRRFTLAGMLFPLQTYRMHPYLGFGFSLSHIPSAEPQAVPYLTNSLYLNSTQQNLVLSTIKFFRSAATPVVILGTQLRLPLASAFGQISTTPANDNFFLFTGTGWRTTFEAGLRYNVGSSIDRLR